MAPYREKHVESSQKDVGCNEEKVAATQGRKTTAKATKSKGRASAVKLKKTMEHMLSKERHNVLSYFLKGGQSSPEQPTEEAILSVGSVVPRALVNSSGGKCPAHFA